MNLHQLVRGAIGAINPDVLLTVKISTGQGVTQPDGARPPLYNTFANVQAQVQPLSTDEIHQMDSLNLQGTRKGVWLNGAVAGLVRATGQGGDLIVTPDQFVWLVAVVFEQWADWCHAGLVLQNGMKP